LPVVHHALLLLFRGAHYFSDKGRLHDAAVCCGLAQEVSMQEEWEEAAERARVILAGVSSATAADTGASEAAGRDEEAEEDDEAPQGAEVEMQDA
jgi:hypothetical protein